MSKRVLIVEDDDLLRDMYWLRLDMEGYEVETACDGIEGIEKVQIAMPDLIILDMLMPRLDGLGFLRRYRDIDAPNKAKVIIASNNSSAQNIHDAKKFGVSDYLIKSQITPDDLVERVKKHIIAQSSASNFDT